MLSYLSYHTNGSHNHQYNEILKIYHSRYNILSGNTLSQKYWRENLVSSLCFELLIIQSKIESNLRGNDRVLRKQITPVPLSLRSRACCLRCHHYGDWWLRHQLISQTCLQLNTEEIYGHSWKSWIFRWIRSRGAYLEKYKFGISTIIWSELIEARGGRAMGGYCQVAGAEAGERWVLLPAGCWGRRGRRGVWEPRVLTSHHFRFCLLSWEQFSINYLQTLLYYLVLCVRSFVCVCT